MKRALELVKKGLSPDFCYSSAMHILLRLADRSFHGGDEITSWTMARELGVAEAVILPILIDLKQGGFVIDADASSGTLNGGFFLPDSLQSLQLKVSRACLPVLWRTSMLL